MDDHTSDRPAHLQGLSDEQVDLYHQMLTEVSAGHGDYWTVLRGLHAPAADKYALAATLGNTMEAREYALQAGIDPHGGKVDMTTLDRGERFIGPDGHTVYVVTTPAAEHEHGWVFVRNLSMSDEEAARRAEHPDVYGPDSRGGFFAYSYPTYVQPIDT
jgi:hypothetical protein